MANYLSAIIIFGLDVTRFANHRLELYRMALELYSPLSVKLNKIIDITLLKNIAEQCDFTQSINQLSRCLISVSTDSKAHHPIRKA